MERGEVQRDEEVWTNVGTHVGQREAYAPRAPRGRPSPSGRRHRREPDAPTPASRGRRGGLYDHRCSPDLWFSDRSGGVQLFFFFSSRRRHTRSDRDWSSDVCSSDLERLIAPISKRRRDDEREPEQTEEPDATPTQTPPADESSVKRDELPVWLL